MFGDCFHGSHPSELGQLSQLAWLSLRQNQFDQNIPSESGLVVALEELSLSDNALGPAFPQESWTSTSNQWPKIRQINLSANQLSGTLPPSLFEHHNASTMPVPQSLTLSQNDFTGTIPESTQGKNMPKLQVLDVPHNVLAGTIPASLCGTLDDLQQVMLQDN